MKLNQLRFLVELKKYGTISKTAEKLFVSQPSLSIAIKELEEELGFDVIKRNRKGVVFTSRGELVLEHCEKVMKEIDEIRLLCDLEQIQGKKGQLIVGCVPYIINTLALDTMMETKRMFPNLVVSLKEESSYELTEMVYRRECDLGIIMMTILEEEMFKHLFQEYHLDFKELFQDEMHVWVGKDNPLYGKSKVTLEEAAQFPFVIYRSLMNEFNKNLYLKYNKNLEFILLDDKESVKKYLSQTHAILIMPMCGMWEDPYFVKKYIKPIKIENFSWRTKVGFLYSKEDFLTLEERSFIDLMTENCQSKEVNGLA